MIHAPMLFLFSEHLLATRNNQRTQGVKALNDALLSGFIQIAKLKKHQSYRLVECGKNIFNVRCAF
jgi:hypothetical protein